MVLTRNQCLIGSMIIMNSCATESTEEFHPRKKLRKICISEDQFGEHNHRQQPVPVGNRAENPEETKGINQSSRSSANERLHAERESSCRNAVATPDRPSAQAVDSNISEYGDGEESPFILARKLLRRRHVRKEQVKKERKIQMARKTHQCSKRKVDDVSTAAATALGDHDECNGQIVVSETTAYNNKKFTKSVQGTPCRSDSRKPSPLSEILMNMSEPMFSPVRSRTDIQHIRTVLFN